jgi:hypothetical protein
VRRGHPDGVQELVHLVTLGSGSGNVGRAPWTVWKRPVRPR